MEPKSTTRNNPFQTNPTIKPNGIKSKNKDSIKKYDREQIRVGLKKRELQSAKSTALGYIRRDKRTGEYDIKAKLHRIVLSTDKSKPEAHTFKAVKGFLGELWFDTNYKPEDRGKMYGVMLIKQLDNFQVNILTDPMSGYYPLMMIEIHPRGDISLETYKTLLLQLSRALPGLKVSKVEYTVDISCPLVADVLFWVFRHSILIPYQKTSKFYPDQFVSLGKRTNCSVTLGDDKFYERGEDGDKKGESWEFGKVNRVRLEHTANWEKLKKHGIRTLEDLIQAPKFYESNRGFWNFKRFKYHKRSKKRLPQEWEDYSEKDDNGYPGSFQAQYIRLGKPRGYVEAVPELTELKAQLVESMKKFDEGWKKYPPSLPWKGVK